MRRDSIGCARVPRHLAGMPRVRSGLEQWLSDCDPARHGLPSGAIVLVRCLRTRWGDVITAERSRRYQDFDTLLATARRPAAGDTPANADVVWFADEAELLACIARDALAGVLRMRWWWRTLAPAAPDGMSAGAPRGFAFGEPGVAHWLAAPRQVPRAVQRLGAAQATLWFAHWTAPERAALVHSLAQTYAVAGAVADWVLEGVLPQPAGVDVRSGTASPATAPAAASAPAARLRRLCAELAADPGAASSPDRAPAMAARLAAYAPPAQMSGPAVREAADNARRPADRAGTTARQAAVHILPQQAEPADAAAAAAGMPEPLPAPSPHPGRAKAVTPPAGGVDSAEPASTPPAIAPATPAAPSVLAAVEDDRADWLAPTVFHTRYGGLLFLLNAALQLSLYGDFSMPAHRRLPCSPWRLLLMAGRAWCGRGFRADPLAGWLARRAGPDLLALAGDWRIDPAWLAPFAKAQSARAPWHAVWEDGRLRLRHPAGFLVCDVADERAACEALLAGELLRLQLTEPPSIVRTAIAHAHRARRAKRSGRHGCPHQLWAYLHARLALALDDGSAADARWRIAAMLNLPARVMERAERADIDFALADLPLAVRLAGLDRDPGWIPAAGCDLRFHFG